MTEQHLTIAYKLLRCRDTCRKFYGDRWKDKQAEWRKIIDAVRSKHKGELLHAAIILGKQLEGFSLMTCLGTIMEMIDEKP